MNQSMFPVSPIWSTGHPPHTATELCCLLPPSRRSSSDLQLCPPLELIFSRYYSVVPLVLNLEDSIQDPFGLHRREVSAMCAPTVPIFFVWFLLLLGLGPFQFQTSLDWYICVFLNVAVDQEFEVGVGQYSVWLQTGRPGFDPRQKQRIFPVASCIQTGSGAHPASYPMGTGGPFPG
jgi:hypothetical protein